MQRIASIDPKAATGTAKTLLDGVQRKLGFVPNLMRTLAVSPAALDACPDSSLLTTEEPMPSPTRRVQFLFGRWGRNRRPEPARPLSKHRASTVAQKTTFARPRIQLLTRNRPQHGAPARPGPVARARSEAGSAGSLAGCAASAAARRSRACCAAPQRSVDKLAWHPGRSPGPVSCARRASRRAASAASLRTASFPPPAAGE